MCDGTEIRTRMAQLSFSGAAASAHYPFLRTYGWYEVCGAELVAHFAPVHEGDNHDDTARKTASTTTTMPPDTYSVAECATVHSLQFVLLRSANIDIESSAYQSVAASLGVEIPHLAELAKTVALAPPALAAVATIQKRNIVAGAEVLLGASQLGLCNSMRI